MEKKPEEKKSFILYRSYSEQFEKLDNEAAGQLIKAIFAYINNETIPEITDKGADMAFSFICSQIDRDQKTYSRRCEVNRTNAKMGGRPKKAKPSEEPDSSQKDSSIPEKELLGEGPKEEMAAHPGEKPIQTSRRKRRIDYPEDFEAFWKIYPRHDGKGDGYEKYKDRLDDGYTPEELLTAAKNYRDWTKRTNKEKQFIKCGKTFLAGTMPFLDFIKMEGDIKEMAQPPKNKNNFNNFQQRDYDYFELERRMYGSDQ